MKWDEIAEQCGTTAGAASKRYSRMKQAFEAGGDAPRSNPGSPAPKTPSKATPRKKKSEDGGAATPTPKRKRASPKKKEVAVKPEPEEDAAEASEDEEEQKQTPKKAKATPKPKAAAVKKEDIRVLTMQGTPVIKNEEVEDDVMDSVEDKHISAEHGVNDLAEADGDEDQDNRKCTHSYSPKHASSPAYVL